jgi:hypothetical protein
MFTVALVRTVEVVSYHPLIPGHGPTGDLQTAAVVTGGTIDWLCAPRLDSSRVFGALWDHRRGGHFATWLFVTAVTPAQLFFIPSSDAVPTVQGAVP